MSEREDGPGEATDGPGRAADGLGQAADGPGRAADGPGPVVVRHAGPEDLARVVELIVEHAEYEKAAPPAPGLADRLARLLFGPEPPRLRCLVAELPDGTLAGYATCAPELSTWDGTEYLHMDCLYLTEAARGHGLGPLLMAAVRREAHRLGLAEIQWQTPAWNENAIRFYDRLGATSKEKRRYSLPVDAQ